ncbi:hypothetical protein RHMOL_Rhmol03G0295200 [Rhododendron molle]|uniref:Uncharacterized protein n=1 Tax=Rhododendron molle TaxID=49168 RepID=A0ACC0PK84_RHOML|nr:hypothetical protein RHMOL_Rhmol03G0295200 [Rhododendron molle]
MCDETKFSVMCSLFNWMQRSKSSAKKRSKFRKFLDNFCKPGDYFNAIRLLLPSLDRQRGSYGLKESVLAACLVDAVGMSRDSQDALRLFNWRKGGAPKAGSNAGNFALIAAEVLQRRQGWASGGLNIKELNEMLDRLASSENRAEKTSVLSDLIKKTNAQEMKWIVMIILKDLKLGVSEKSIFHEFHPDADDLFNVTCDLKLVCEKLRDRSQRHKRQDIEVGKPVRPQLAMRVGNANNAWKKLHGKEVVAECKFDGDRIQIHKNGQEIHFFSRNFLDHPEYGHSMSAIIIQSIIADRCILDGEMLVWDTSMNRFADFGSNQEIAKVAKEGLDSDRQMVKKVVQQKFLFFWNLNLKEDSLDFSLPYMNGLDVAFDILYFGDTSVIHQSLKERHELLRKVVKPVKGRLEVLVPNGGLNDRRPSGEPCWSLIAYSVDDIERFFKETIENRDEGIVVKDLGSKWEPSDRSGKWLKLKPDYIRAGSDLDVLIIGGYYGSGRRGGEVAQFLVGLAERSAPDTYPKRFISFCRVGTGLSDEELDAVVTKLKPYYRKNEYPKKASPSFYQVTNNSKERPDVWIESPEKSIILSITSDIRTIRSEVFAAPYSLRFPRIDRVRYDKPWHECLDVQSFVELVHSSNGTTQRDADYGVVQVDKPKRMKSSRKGEKKSVSVVPSHFVQTDISTIKGETLIFSSMMLCMKFQAAKRHGDIIHYSWLFDCCSQKKLLPLQPKYFLFLSDSSRKKLQEEIDGFSDPYYWDLDIKDIKQLLSNINRSEDSKTVEHYKRKFCPKARWCCFHGCCIYFHPSVQELNSDTKLLTELALRRMKLEVSNSGGQVSNSLSRATHLVVTAPLGLNVDFVTVLKSYSSEEARLLRRRSLHVVWSQWLEDSLDREERVQEETYSLKPTGLEESNSGAWKDDLSLDELSNIGAVERPNTSSSPTNDGGHSKGKAALDEPRLLTSPKKIGKRKRGRPLGTCVNKGQKGVLQPRRTRSLLGSKSAKIHEIEPDLTSSEENAVTEESEMELGNQESKHEVIVEDSDSPNRGKAVKPEEVGEDTILGEWFNNSHGIKSGSGNSAQENEKLEVLVDPVQSMLLDMIPSLKTKKVESIDPVVEDQKPPEDTDDNAVPVKKKKRVSYKDVAMELLRDL